MKVLLDLTSLDTPARDRGHGRYVRVLARGLAELPRAELGSLEILALTHLRLDGAYRVTDDITAFHGSPELSAPGPKDHYRWAYARRIALWRAVGAIGASAVHLGDPNATPLFIGLTKCKKIVTCHDTIPARFPGVYFGLRDGGSIAGLAIEKRRYRSADLVIAISEATRRDACTYLGVAPERIVRIHNGVDIERWSREPLLEKAAVLEKFRLQGESFALYVGASDWHKNIEGMLQGLAAARKQGKGTILAWAGRLRDDHARAMGDLARRIGVGDAVRMLGFVSDEELGVLYRAACAHVLVSRCEGFGLTVVEAMASGCPVLTTRGGSLDEVAGDAALTVDPDDHAAIGGALIRLSSDGALRADLAERGRQRAPQFSRAVQATAMARAYRRLLEA
ncbi:MAG TPA: glycosyltransferase family 1 protein [Polyangiaceae bacterium]|nr:glycosyltransferase family 1 protein [Polyangiaceae bacterium]